MQSRPEWLQRIMGKFMHANHSDEVNHYFEIIGFQQLTSTVAIIVQCIYNSPFIGSSPFMYYPQLYVLQFDKALCTLCYRIACLDTAWTLLPTDDIRIIAVTSMRMCTGEQFLQ